jgi:hypothetical protein
MTITRSVDAVLNVRRNAIQTLSKLSILSKSNHQALEEPDLHTL